ncbi:hypothetical protein D3C73_1517920 [compost metagenome]
MVIAADDHIASVLPTFAYNHQMHAILRGFPKILDSLRKLNGYSGLKLIQRDILHRNSHGATPF